MEKAQKFYIFTFESPFSILKLLKNPIIIIFTNFYYFLGVFNAIIVIKSIPITILVHTIRYNAY
jgi:hypothetical protein